MIGDVAIRGVWQPQATAFFDIRVIDTDTRSHVCQSPNVVLSNAEREKKQKYSDACNTRHVSFTPLCFSVNGLVGKEAKVFLDLLVEKLALKWGKPYSCVVHWLRAKMSFALLRTTDLRIRSWNKGCNPRTEWVGWCYN